MARVAIINTNDDVVDMLRIALEHEGIDAVPAHVIDFKRGKADFDEFVARHNPKVIVYDVAPPYRENWEFFQVLASSEAGKNRRWVLTTTNKKLVSQAAGQEVDAYEISEKPYDVNAIIQSVKRELS